VTPGPEVSRLLYGATLMDTENRLDAKMTYRDESIMDRLRASAGVDDDAALYHELMSALLGTTDAELLFRRDYKQDWGTYGFAVAKVKGCFGADGGCLRQGLLDDLVDLANSNNRSKNFPLTIVKLVNYGHDNDRVERERMYLVFNEHAAPGIRAEPSDRAYRRRLARRVPNRGWRDYVTPSFHFQARWRRVSRAPPGFLTGSRTFPSRSITSSSRS